MRWHHLNPFRHARIEREVEIERAQMVRAREGAKRAAESFYQSIGRQAPSGSETELRSRVVQLQGHANALEIGLGLALEELRRGRTGHAESVLAAMLAHIDIDQREAS